LCFSLSLPPLHPLDIVVVLIYLALLSIVGVYFSRQSNLDQYLVAARRMTWLPVGLSLMAALNSGIDYLTQPSATIRYGLVLLVGPLSWIPLYFWVSRVAFPFFHRLDLYTAYEYLETRFDVRVRVLAAIIFIIWRLGWMATALYVPCLAINAASHGALDLTTTIVVLGILVTGYTMLGGIQAVIWNDVVQFFVMFGGLAATLAITIASVPGGMPEVWSTASEAGKTAMWVPLTDVLRQPITVPALLMALVVGRMAQYTSDQVMVQRLQTTRSVQDARQAFLVNAAGDALWMVGLSFVGLALFAYFQHVPASQEIEADRLLPHFMTIAFPVGAVGLVIAAILAASLSSVDSAIHACSSVLIVDIYNRLLARQPGRVTAMRVATIIVGITGTTLAVNVSKIGNLLEIANKLINSFSGPLFGIFVLAMFNHRAGSAAALIGGVIGAITSYLVAYQSSYSFLWPSTFGFAATVLTGSVMAFIIRDKGKTEWTWHAVMQRPEKAARPANG
jgi:SSS family transporter